MVFPRISIARLMIIVAIVAADLAALLATLPAIPNPGLALMVVILEVGLLVAVARRGAARRFWVGFEAFGWSYVLACFFFNRTAWRLARGLFEGYVLGAKVGTPGEMWQFILFSGCLQLVLSLVVALAGGLLCRRLMRGVPNGGIVHGQVPPDPVAGETSPGRLLRRIGLCPVPDPS
jgi:hypothetical protein